MQERERRLVQKEVIKSPEIWIPKFAVITISGPSGVGKTTIARELAKRFSIPEERNIKAGQLIREEAGKENEVGFIERPLAVDKKLDQMQKEKIASADPNKPIVMEGRLAGFHASQMRIKEELKYPIVTFLLTANREIRYRRIWNRERESDPGRSQKEVAVKTHEREKKDRMRWKKLYHSLPDGDPFIPGAKDKRGNEIYDYIISTNHRNVAEVEAEIHNFLRDKGLVTKG